MFYANYQENKQFQVQTNIKPMKYGADNKQIKLKKNTYKFNYDRDRKIQISSDFDNGNISLIKQVTQFQYRLECAPDVANGSNKKSWFYFKVTAAKYIKLRFYVEGLGIYESMYQEYNWAKPVYKIGEEGKWSTLHDSYLILRDEVNLMIDFCFQTEEPVYFAMSIPFSYWEMEDYLNTLKYTAPDCVNYNDEVILETKTKKNLHMLTIEDKQLKKYKQSSNSARSIILITSRVHPGQVSGSFCLMGMLDFILRPFSLQSQILRKMFTFVIFPIVNPEGVYQGNYRMDLNGENLNRVYLEPHPTKHQTVYAIKQKINQFLKRGDKIMFHFDLHSHSTLRKSFIYGNAFDDIILQAQSQIFCKLLDGNCVYFQQSLSQFGQKHMKFKDKGENMSKEGCARVVLSKMAGITYSYTVESSIFPIQPKRYSQDKNRSKCYEPTNLNFEIQSLCYDSFEDKSRQYSEQPNIVDQNKVLGNKIMLTILDIFTKNPYSPLEQKDIDEIRKQIAVRILQNEERFKLLDTKAYHKSKFISQFSKNQFYSKFRDQWNWLISNKKFSNISWPQNFTWFKYKVQRQTKRANSNKTQVKQCKLEAIQSLDYTVLSQRCSDLITKLKQNQQNLQDKIQIQRLPMIRKSLENKKIKTEEKKDLSENIKIQQSEKFKKSSRNVLVTNRSNILLTFLDDEQEKVQKRIVNKKKIISMRINALNRMEGQKSSNSQKILPNQLESIQPQLLMERKPFQNDQLIGLKLSHSQGQLHILPFKQKIRSSNEHKQKQQQGVQFQDKLLSKNIETKVSRKEVLNRKISMLKKANEMKKNVGKAPMMKFPQIGKSFLITNAKKKLERIKTSIQQQENEQSSTIQSNQMLRQKMDMRVKTQASIN